MEATGITLKDIVFFFTGFKDSLEKYSPKQVADHYEFPFLFISDQSKNMYTSSSELEELFRQMSIQYKHYNITKARFDILFCRKITDQIYYVEVEWDFLYPNEEKVYSCHYNYMLRKEASGKLKITSLVSVNEHIKLQQLLAGAGAMIN